MTDAPAIPRRGARRQPVDLTTFAQDVEAALAAFRHDISYAVLIARAAVTITRKRAASEARRELRVAEEKAREECELVSPFECHAVSPCGTGDCKFAEYEYALLNVPDCAGKTNRPQRSAAGDYTIEAAVEPLLQLHATSP